MATGGKFSTSLSQGSDGFSDELFDHCCTPCSKQGNSVEAFHQCVECEEYYCGKCLDFHGRFGATSGHKVLGKDKMGKAAGLSPQKQLPTQRCHVHHGQRVEIYCANHDVICCNICASINHNSCGGKTYIIDAAKGVKTGKELRTTRDRLTAVLEEIRKARDTHQTTTATQDTDKAARIKKAREFAKRMIKRINDLERSTVDEIARKHEGLSAETAADGAALDTMLSVVEEDLRKLDQSQKKPDSQVFVDIKLGQGHETEGIKLLQHVTRPRQTDIKFALNTDMEECLNGIRSLGIFADYNKIYKAKFRGSYNVNIQEDRNTCDITGTCLLPDGTMVITDWLNSCLKRLDPSYRVTDYCVMPASPWGVTRTTPGEIAITMANLKTVQFVSTGASMSLTRSFSTDDRCRGVCHSKGELFVSCAGLAKKGWDEGPGYVAVYDLSGTRLRTMQTDSSRQNIFSCPRHITIISDGSRVYVADWKAGIISLDRKGKGVCSLSDPSLIHAYGLCLLDNGHILAGGYDSNNVLQFDGDGRKIVELLRDNGDGKKPHSLCYDGNRSRLVIAVKETDIIKVFDLV